MPTQCLFRRKFDGAVTRKYDIRTWLLAYGAGDGLRLWRRHAVVILLVAAAVLLGRPRYIGCVRISRSLSRRSRVVREAASGRSPFVVMETSVPVYLSEGRSPDPADRRRGRAIQKGRAGNEGHRGDAQSTAR